MDDFIPWDSPTGSLHFNVLIDGVPHAARVTRDCLVEHKLVDFRTTTREQFAAGPNADKLRNRASSMIGQNEEPLITRDNWKQNERE